MLTCRINCTVLCIAAVALTVWTAPAQVRAAPGDVNADGTIGSLQLADFVVAVEPAH